MSVMKGTDATKPSRQTTSATSSLRYRPKRGVSDTIVATPARTGCLTQRHMRGATTSAAAQPHVATHGHCLLDKRTGYLQSTHSFCLPPSAQNCARPLVCSCLRDRGGARGRANVIDQEQRAAPSTSANMLSRPKSHKVANHVTASKLPHPLLSSGISAGYTCARARCFEIRSTSRIGASPCVAAAWQPR